MWSDCTSSLEYHVEKLHSVEALLKSMDAARMMMMIRGRLKGELGSHAKEKSGISDVSYVKIYKCFGSSGTLASGEKDFSIELSLRNVEVTEETH